MKSKILSGIVFIVVSAVIIYPVFKYTDMCISAQESYCDPIYGILAFPIIWMGVTYGIYKLIYYIVNKLK